MNNFQKLLGLIIELPLNHAGLDHIQLGTLTQYSEVASNYQL